MKQFTLSFMEELKCSINNKRSGSTAISQGFPGGSVVKNPPAEQETRAQPLGWEDSLEKEMATHSSILA